MRFSVTEDLSRPPQHPPLPFEIVSDDCLETARVQHVVIHADDVVDFRTDRIVLTLPNRLPGVAVHRRHDLFVAGEENHLVTVCDDFVIAPAIEIHAFGTPTMTADQLVFLAAAFVAFCESNGAGVWVERKHDSHTAVGKQIAATDRHLNRRPRLSTGLRFVTQERTPNRLAAVVGIESVHGDRTSGVHRHDDHIAIGDRSRHESAAGDVFFVGLGIVRAGCLLLGQPPAH